MKKTEMYNLQHIIGNMESHFWDRWLDYWCEQKKIDRRGEGWVGVAESIPSIYDWTIQGDKMCIRWISEENGEEQEELVPLSVFVDDLDEQPDLEMLWHCNYWDGPLSGVARYNGEMVWFDVEDQGDWGDDCVRSYQLYRFDKATMDETVRRHNLFRDMVGHHSDHLPEQHDEYVCKDKDKFKAFYAMSEEWEAPDFEQFEKLGVFAYHQFKYYARPR